jgi:PadR family transcriptional regulator PadR
MGKSGRLSPLAPMARDEAASICELMLGLETLDAYSGGAERRAMQGRSKRLTTKLDLFYCVKHMPRGEILGPLEQIILLALVRLNSKAYGMTVRREIEERTGRNISIGAIYATLERLESKGYVSSFTGAPTPERGGRAKRFFRLEAGGEEALRLSHDAIRKMTRGLKWRWEIT